MPAHKKYVVWTWFDEDETPKFVGWGVYSRTHPAKTLWAQRNGIDSDLHIWLRKFKTEPKRVERTGLVQYYRAEASAVAAVLREKCAKDGYKLLDPRPWGTKEGGGAARMVISPDFAIFGSVRKAAVDMGVNPCTITRWCQTDGSGWDYIT